MANGYLASNDERIAKIRETFEEALTGLPEEWNGWQTFKTMRRAGDIITVEIISSFRVRAPLKKDCHYTLKKD